MPNEMQEVAAVGEIAEGQMREVKVGEKKILLANIEGQVFATAGECPHYGMSLAEGTLCGKRVICPWHKAVFDVTDGALLEPPALDGLAAYPVTVKDGKILVDLAEKPKPEIRRTADGEGRCFVVAGAGAAATAAAGNLRALGFEGRVVLLSGEDELPYDRTTLSKEVLSDKAKPEELLLRSPEFWEENRVERIAKTVVSLDSTKHEVGLSGGSTLRYDKLLLATGAAPGPIEIKGGALQNVFTLRSHADAERILKQTKSATHTVVIGGSFIAMEVASCFATQKLPVTVIVAGSRPFEKQLGPEVGAIIQKLHEQHGVKFELSAEVESLEGSGVVSGVKLKTGKIVPGDLVVVGAGVKPVTDYGSKLVRDKEGGILVDEFLKAGEDIYAAGDIAVFPEKYSRTQVRIEHWRVALQQGRVAAGNMLGEAKVFEGVPYFWTNHFDTRFDYLGHAEHWDDIQLDADETDFPTFIAHYFKKGRLVAAAACQRDLEINALHEQMRTGQLSV